MGDEEKGPLKTDKHIEQEDLRIMFRSNLWICLLTMN